MAIDTPLNNLQIDVLRWISEGCPEGRWQDSSYKTSAASLQARRLITISKRGGWKAKIEPAGLYYLEHGDYPRNHFPDKPRSFQRTMRLARSEAGEAQKPLTRPAPNELTPTQKLLKDIAAAGGVLQIDTKDDNTNYANLVAIINRRGLAPDGQQVISVRGERYRDLIFRFASVTEWKTEPPTALAEAARIKWHPVVAALRADKRLDAIAAPQRSRAWRLLQSLAQEAQARGHGVQERRPDRNHYSSSQDRLKGCLIIEVSPIKCSVSISQLNDRIPHEPTAKELEKARRESWYRIPTHDYVPSERLSIAVDTDSRWNTGESWPDTKTIPLELRLPDVMTMFERWAVIDRERTEAERLAEIKRQEEEDRRDELARTAYFQHRLGSHLRADLEAWELVGRLDQYLAAMRARIDETDPEARAEGVEWLAWCEQFQQDIDPLRKAIKKPSIKEPGYSEIAEFRKRLGLGSVSRPWM